MAITLYGRHTSYNVQKVLWLLDDFELAYRHIEFGSNPSDTETASFAKLNPMRKVPVLVDGEHVLWESNTILRYILNRYAVGDWKQQDAYQISLYERWMDWSQTYLEPAFVGVFWGYYRTPVELHDKTKISDSLGICMKALSILNDQLSKTEYLAGNTISLADVSVGVFLYRLDEIDLEITFPEHVGAWYGRLKNCEGFQRWAMSDFSSLKGRLQY